MHGFIALQECIIKVAVNGITLRNTQMGGSFQSHRKTRVNKNISCGIIQKTKAIIIATDNRITFLNCWSRRRWWQDNCCFLNFFFKVNAMVPYTRAKRQMGTMIKVMNVAVIYLLFVSPWSNAGAQDNWQYRSFSKGNSRKA